MADIERLSIALPRPMADNVRRAIEAGEYASTSEVIRDALRLWESRRQLRERDLEILRQRWDDGKASGAAGPLDIAGLIAEERVKFTGKPRSVAKITLSRRAEAELREIWRYIAGDSPRLRSRIDAYRCQTPTIGGFSRQEPYANDIRPGLRMLVEGHYLLLYEHRLTDGVVELVTVVDGRRDLGRGFELRPSICLPHALVHNIRLHAGEGRGEGDRRVRGLMPVVVSAAVPAWWMSAFRPRAPG